LTALKLAFFVVRNFIKEIKFDKVYENDMSNYLLPSITAYFEEICSLIGKLHLVSSSLEEHSKNLIEKDEIQGEIISSITTYRDLSQIPGTNNLYTPNFSYGITLNTLSKEVENLISRESCFTVAQAYEVFESYFLQILTDYFKHRTDKLTELNLLKVDLISESDIKTFLKIAAGSNNKGLIKLAKKISDHFKKHENDNYFSVNIFRWFDLISMVRHTLVHNRQKVSKRFLTYLEENKSNRLIELFDAQFERKKIDNIECIFLTTNRALDIITWLNSFAHLIFKSISIDSGLDFDIPKYIPPPLQWYRNR
jgi:hypothetical protein